MKKHKSLLEMPIEATYYNGTNPAIAVKIIGTVIVEMSQSFKTQVLVQDNNGMEFSCDHSDIHKNW